MMKLTKIKIENFRSISAYETPLDNVTVFFGQNGAGKTTIAQSIQMLLHGRCALTAKDGKGFTGLIRDGAKSAVIEADTDDGTLVAELGKKREFTATNGDGEVIDYPSSPEAMVAAMPEVFLDSGELDGILSKILIKQVAHVDLLNAAGEMGEWLESRLPKVLTADTMSSIGQRAYDERTEVNREIKAIKMRLDEYGFAGGVKDAQGKSRTPDEIPTIRKQCDRLHEKIDALNRELGAAQAAPDRAALQSELDAMNLSSMAEARNEANLKYAQASEAYQECRAAYDAMVNELKAIEKHTGPQYVCEKCGHSPVADNSEAIEKLKAEIDAHDIHAVKDAMDQAKRASEDARVAHDVAYQRAQEIKAALAVNARNPEIVERELLTTRETLERGEGLIKQMERLGNIGGEKERLAECEAEVERLDWAVNAFKKGELTKQFIGSGSQEFVATLNNTMAHFGHECDVLVDGKTVSLTFDGRPVMYCSEGERLLVQTCLALAFAQRSGWPAVVDNVNHLDAVNRKTMLKLLRESNAQIFLFCAWQQSNTDLDPVQKALAPCKVVWVDNA